MGISIRKKIFFDVCGNDNWIGGIYYLKNILWSINYNENIKRNYKIIVLTDRRYKELFEKLEDGMEIHYYNSNSKISRLILLLKILLIRQVDYIYYYHEYKFDLFNILRKKAIYWVPDFQELHYPEYFTENQLVERKERICNILQSDRPLVLSSEDCIKDMETYNFDINKKPYLVRFVSYIEDEVGNLTDEFCSNILDKYNLQNKNYFFISNQFWQHKNHNVILKMIKKYKDEIVMRKILFVFSGSVKDYRNKSFYNELLKYINDNDVKDKIRILGFIDREDQLALMKKSRAVIQPTLFEGWGTVLEDSKVLDKIVILSDIPVHREQKNDNCIMFNPNDVDSLYLSIMKCLTIKHNDNIKIGINQMKKNAFEYSKELERLFKDYRN
ncbi:glycosyltransferase family 4 protein [Clostridium botulinum]|nr:glycosyltransferase family 4 protein [Clostridium botulinum]